MLYTVMIILGFFAAIFGGIGCLVSIIEDHKLKYSILLGCVCAIGITMCIMGSSGMNTYTIQDITVKHFFVNEHHYLQTGFIDSNDQEYYYSKDVLEINKTYKMRIKTDNDFDKKYVEYIYT